VKGADIDLANAWVAQSTFFTTIIIVFGVQKRLLAKLNI